MQGQMEIPKQVMGPFVMDFYATMLERGLVLPAYDYAVKLSHIFNILDLYDCCHHLLDLWVNTGWFFDIS